jgi:DNA invertase Pin-like site-specific DNA recombinase
VNTSPPIKRAAIYARYSTDLQKDRSIADQIAVCRSYAERHGYHVVEVFEDRAASGASIHGRPGIQKLIQAVKNKQFEAVISENLSRIGRDQEDRHGIRKRLNYQGVDLITPIDGVVSPLVDGLRGIIDQQFLDDLKGMIRRGMSGLIRNGKSAGGRCYGYRPSPKFENGEVIRGDLEIVEVEAEVVRQIFREFVSGRTPRQIAHDLNRDHIAPPRGRKWNASTINGSPQRGTGILRNGLYAGRLQWNWVRMVKDPDTGKRVSRPNPPSERQTTPVPHLAIVPVDLYEAAQARKAELTHVLPHKQRAPKRMLSGLLRCGSCGGGMSTKGKDKSGRVRLECSNARENGTCSDPKTFYVDEVEDAVITGLQAELKSPQVFIAYAREYHAERQRLAAKTSSNIARLERRRGEIDREVARLVEGIAKGIDPTVLGDRINTLRAERREIEGQLEATRSRPVAITLHPGALKLYTEQLDRLQECIGSAINAGDVKLVAAIRDLIESVTVRRKASGVEVEITGRLNALIGDQAFPKGRVSSGGIAGSGGGI